ncbi:MAG: hypothetical protein EBU84_00795 [Actinobacteria bacterium]|nr:hypothetical protein [Actinomycetota bacterium]
MNWVYQILKAILDWLRETPPPTVLPGNAPDDLRDRLQHRIDGMRDGKGDPGPGRSAGDAG